MQQPFWGGNCIVRQTTATRLAHQACKSTALDVQTAALTLWKGSTHGVIQIQQHW